MKAFARILMCAAVLMSCVVCSSCSKDEVDDGGDREITDGIMATHKFYVTPDMLKFIDVNIEWTDFEGNVVKEKVTNEYVLEREYITDKLEGSTSMKVKITRKDVEIDPNGEYDIAVTYDFSAIRLFGSNGTGKAITTGQPIEGFREKHVNIHKTFLESILYRLPKDVTITHLFDDTTFGVQHFPVIEYGDSKE
jgi:hypothetical protein